MRARRPLALLVVALVSGSPGAAQAPPLVLTHATVIDGVSPQPLREATVVVRGGRIEAVRPRAATPPAGATALDLAGRGREPAVVAVSRA